MEQQPYRKGWFYSARWAPRFVRSGITFGSALAIVLSYTKNSSILWAILHGLMSWIYVVYRAVLKIGWF